MKVLVIAEIELETGEYQLTFRNKSHPGQPMDLAQVRGAFLLVAKDFAAEKSEETPNPGVMLS
jgi:hypothetical protein